MSTSFLNPIRAAFFTLLLLLPFCAVAESLSPQKLTSEIALYVMRNGVKTPFNVDSPDEGKKYAIRFYTKDREIYIVKVTVYNNGENWENALDISYYYTSQLFQDLSHPADPIANELISGTPKIIAEQHLYDEKMDGVIELFQEFTKHNKDGLWEGFTREERELGEKAGVKDFLFENGSVKTKKGLRKPTRDESRSVHFEHGRRLERIAEEFKIQ